MKIIFLDFDGVMIPSRSYNMPGQTRPIVSQFDPCAVGLLNTLCRDIDAKIVLVTSWRRTEMWRQNIAKDASTLKEHCLNQGLKPEFLHDDFECPTYHFSATKYHDVNLWLEEHPEVTSFVIIDDHLNDEHAPDNQKGHIVTPDFDDGITYYEVRQMVDILTNKEVKKETK